MGYKIVKDFRDNEKIRYAFNKLTEDTFGFSFENWYQDGYWKDNYRPYGIMDGDRMISNVSVNPMTFNIKGEERTFVQLGTIMTSKDSRNKGLARFIMEAVLEEWKDKCDLVFLFANDSVVEFYPKFGFKEVDQWQSSKAITTEGLGLARKLDMSKEEDRQIFVSCSNKTLPQSNLAMVDNIELLMFYCTSFMSDYVYYDSNNDAVIIAKHTEEGIFIFDILAEHKMTLDEAVNTLPFPKSKAIVCGFTPLKTDSYKTEILKEEDTTLFILGDADFLSEHKLMFPVLSHT